MDGRILLVDDEKDILDLLEEVLRRDGFREIRRAKDGAGAIRACREFLPDAVVLDIMLPDMDGLEVCKQIREFSYCSILFLSSKTTILIRFSAFPAAATITSQNLSAPGRWCSA